MHKDRKLGSSSLIVSPICLGGNVFGWTLDQTQSFAVLDAWAERNFNFIDTADVYSKWKPGNHGGESETILGHWFKHSGRRDRTILATKVGMELAPEKKGLKKDYILRAAEDSLRRLQTDYIDLYQAHRDDQSVPLDETLSAFDQLIKAGKVRAIGASNYAAERLGEALRVSRAKNLPAYQSLQPLYNLYERDEYERTLEPIVAASGIGVIPYYSLASGFLTGKYRTAADAAKSPRGEGIRKKYLNDRGLKILAALDRVAKQTQSTPAAIALAWLLAKPTITAPIASATSIAHIETLTAAAALTLDPATITQLDTASAH
jgi:aryl-alcohol dehydrogenase-like predicted oxidoreductase